MRFLTRWFIRYPAIILLTVFAIGFSIANRRTVLVSLDPFSESAPALGLMMPTWMLVFGTLILGMLLGGFATWTAQARTTIRKSARKRAAKREAEADTAQPETPIIAPEKKVSVLTGPARKKAQAGKSG